MRRRRRNLVDFEAETDLTAIRGDLTLAERSEEGRLNDADGVFDSSAGQEQNDLPIPAQRHLVDFFSQPYATKMILSHTRRGARKTVWQGSNIRLPATYLRA